MHDDSPDTGLPWQQAGSWFDPFGVARALSRVQAAWLQNPEMMAEALTRLGRELSAEQMHAWLRWWGIPTRDIFPPVEHDARFADPAWVENPLLDQLKELYLLQTHWLQDLIYDTPGVSEQDRRRAAFWVRQWLDAVAPSNFFWTNPEAFTRFLKSGGESVVNGFQNWLRDLARGTVSMVEQDAFKVGEDLATTPGEVVLRNDLLELIQYAPATARVHAVPIVLIAPWINKYYILDLGERKSLIRFLVGRGFTVFVTSWRNPGSEQREVGFEDYMMRGALAAVTTARDICGGSPVHAVGYCLGGTILAAALAWLNAGQAEDENPIAHGSLLTTLVDFKDPGEIRVFLDADSLAFLERRMVRKGYLKGADMARSFRMLRPNSLIWHYVVRSYLYGEELPASDVLYWNMDTTRMPEAMHRFYLRELYLNNRLVQPGGLTLAGRSLDLGRIRQPLYVVGAEQDHITPWPETFRVCSLVAGPVRYVLASSGHILGIINPPVDPPKRRYWAGDAGGQNNPEAWRHAMDKRPGTWWEDWVPWLAERCGPLVEPPAMGSERFPALGHAPGGYVFG